MQLAMFESPSQFSALRLVGCIASARVPASPRHSRLAFVACWRQDRQLFIGSDLLCSRVPASSRHSDWPVAVFVRESQPVGGTLDRYFIYGAMKPVPASVDVDLDLRVQASYQV